MNNSQPIVINFHSQSEVEEQSYQIILKTVNDAFLAARGNLQKMEELNQLAKELRFETESAMAELRYGPVVPKINVLPESGS